MPFAFIKKQRTFFKFLIVIILLFLVSLQQYLKKPLVSVVMPTYNRVELLPRAIDSILAQTMKDFEFIIVDDGSTDNTAQLLQEYQQKDSRIKVITLPQNKGISTARATGNQAARGKYITVMDSDDIALPHLLEKTSEYLDNYPIVTIVQPAGRDYQEGTNPYRENYYYAFPIYQIVFASRLGNIGITFRNEFMKRHKVAPDPKITCGEDYDFWIKMIKAGASLVHLGNKEPLYIKRMHTTSNYTDCERSSQLIFNDFMDFLKIPSEKISNHCFVFKRAIQFNPTLFNKETIEMALRAYCPPQSQFYIKINHPDWTDYFVFSNDRKRIFRHSLPNEKASVISFIPEKKITVKWDTWGKETFYFGSDNTYQFDNRK